jgi:lariat debranching enzyme
MPKVFVTGCLHGSWDLLIDTVEKLIRDGTNIELVLVNGDAQTFRKEEDMLSFAAPKKYHLMGSFYKIASGERKVPCPVVLISGNHEAMDLVFQLPFGGYIAPNVYYMGRGGQLLVGDILISGISGLYKSGEYYNPVKETFPLRTPADIHTAIGIRAFTDFQLFGLKKTQIMMSHDWPSTIPSKYATNFLRKVRPDLIESDMKGTFGLPLGMKFIEEVKPSTWFAAHHHLSMTIKINDQTNFCALTKPRRNNKWYIIADIEGTMGPIKIAGEWISILKATGDVMENPSLLKCDWKELWAEKQPLLEKCEAVDLDPFNPDPVKTTIDFCKKHGIYCPNPEIREIMNGV